MQVFDHVPNPSRLWFSVVFSFVSLRSCISSLMPDLSNLPKHFWPDGSSLKPMLHIQRYPTEPLIFIHFPFLHRPGTISQTWSTETKRAQEMSLSFSGLSNNWISNQVFCNLHVVNPHRSHIAYNRRGLIYIYRPRNKTVENINWWHSRFPGYRPHKSRYSAKKD